MSLKISQLPVVSGMAATDDIIVNSYNGSAYATQRISYQNILTGLNTGLVVTPTALNENLWLASRMARASRYRSVNRFAWTGQSRKLYTGHSLTVVFGGF